MWRRLLSVSGFTLLSRITGLIRDISMATILGSGLMSDAFLFAFLFPNYFRAIFGEGTINPAFLPRYAALHAKGEHDAAARFADRIFSWQMAAQAFILVVALVAMPLLVQVFVPGYTPEQKALTASLARITFPYLILTVVAIQLSAMLNAIEKFWAAAAWSNLLNLAMIATLLAWHWFPSAAYAAAWGVALGGVAQLLFMLWAGRKEGLHLRLVGLVWTPEVKEFFKAYGVVTFGAASVVVAPLIDFFIASYLAEGSRTALYYADRINQLPMGTLGIAIGTVLLPEMAARLARDDRAGADEAQNRAAALGLYLTLPFVAAFFAIPIIIMRGLFAHGAFHLQAADISAAALMAYGVGLPAFVLVRCVSPVFYARGDTATPVRATIASVAVNVALKFALVWGLHFGAVGIALGTSLAAWVNVGVLVYMAERRELLTINAAFLRSLPGIFSSAIATGAGAFGGAWLWARAVPGTGAIHDAAMLGAGVMCGTAAYLTMTFVFRRTLPIGRGSAFA
jgi:putative peptidoglycan lipid II flippase